MPDIAMCSGEEAGKVCPKRDTCWRFTATPSDGRQSYFLIAPFHLAASRGDECTHYYPTTPREP